MALGPNIAPFNAVTPTLARIAPNVSDLGAPADTLIFINDQSSDTARVWDSFDSSTGNLPPRVIDNIDIPAEMRTVPWEFTWTADTASTATVSDAPTFISFTPDDFGSFWFDRNNQRFAINDTTGSTLLLDVAGGWTNGAVINFRFDPVALTLTISGTGLTGGAVGTHPISGTLSDFWPAANDIMIGGGFTGFGTFGTYSDIMSDPDPGASILIDLTGGANNPPRTILNANIPAVMRTEPWRFSWTAPTDSESSPNAFSQFVSWSADDLAGIYYDRVATGFHVSNTSGVNVMSVFGSSWNSGQTITLELDPIGMTLTISGAENGNGVHSISGTLAGFWPTNANMRIGGGFTAGVDTGGTYSDITGEEDAGDPELLIDLTTDASTTFTYFGYHFGGTQRYIGRLIWKTGGDGFGTSGGWFEAMTGGNSYVEYATAWSGTEATGWTRLTALQAPVTPAYAADETTNGWLSYQFDFLAQCYGIRLSGDPGGTQNFVAAWELEVYEEEDPPGGDIDLTGARVQTQTSFPSSTIEIGLSGARAQTQTNFPAPHLRRHLISSVVATQSSVLASVLSLDLHPPALVVQSTFPPSSLTGADVLGPPALALVSAVLPFSLTIELSGARVQTQSSITGHFVGSPAELTVTTPIIALVTVPALSVSKQSYTANVAASLIPISLKNPGLRAYLNDGLQASGTTQVFDSFDVADQSRIFDWFGYSFDGLQKKIGKLRLVTGPNTYGPGSGGWFNTLQIEYATNSGLTSWLPVTDLASSPNYPSDESSMGWRSYEFVFNATPLCYGIRVSGDPGGTSNFVAATELEVFEVYDLPADLVLTATAPLATQSTLPAVVLETRMNQATSLQQRAVMPASSLSIHLSASPVVAAVVVQAPTLITGVILQPPALVVQSAFPAASVDRIIHPSKLTLRGDFFDSKLEIGLSGARAQTHTSFPSPTVILSTTIFPPAVATQTQFPPSTIEEIPVEENELRPPPLVLIGQSNTHNLETHHNVTIVVLPTQSQILPSKLSLVLNASPVVVQSAIPPSFLSLADRDLFADPMVVQSSFPTSVLALVLNAPAIATQSAVPPLTITQIGNLAQGVPLVAAVGVPQAKLSVHLTVQGPISTQSAILPMGMTIRLNANPQVVQSVFGAADLPQHLNAPSVTVSSYVNDHRLELHLTAPSVIASVAINPITLEITEHLYPQPVLAQTAFPPASIELSLVAPALVVRSSMTGHVVERVGDLYMPVLGLVSTFPPASIEKLVSLGVVQTVVSVRGVVVFEGTTAPGTVSVGKLVPLTAVLPTGRVGRVGVPVHASKPLSYAKGELVTLRYAMVDSSGVQIDLRPSSNYMVLIVRKSASVQPAIRMIATKRPNIGKHVADFPLSSTFWARLTPGVWRYDTWLVRGSEQSQVVPYSYFHVSPGQGPGISLPEPPPSTGGDDFDFGET